MNDADGELSEYIITDNKETDTENGLTATIIFITSVFLFFAFSIFPMVLMHIFFPSKTSVLHSFSFTSVSFYVFLKLMSVVMPITCGIFLPAFIISKIRKKDLSKVYFLKNTTKKSWILSFAIIPFAFLLSLGFALLQMPLFDSANLTDLERDMHYMMYFLYKIGGGGLLFFVVSLIPGFCEEFLCRGVLLSGYKKSMGKYGAIFLSAFLFAILHCSPMRFFPQFFLGVLLAIVVLRTGSIFPAMIMHAGHNAIALFAGFSSLTKPFNTKNFVPPKEAMLAELQKAKAPGFLLEHPDIIFIIQGIILILISAASISVIVYFMNKNNQASEKNHSLQSNKPTHN